MKATFEASCVPPFRKPPAGRQRICSEQQVKLIDPIWVVGPVRRKGFWDDAENCRNYLFWLAHKLHFRYMQDWYESTDAQFYNNKGMSLLRRHDWTRVEVVKAYFPQYDWYEWLFRTTPRGFWHKPENRQRYYAWLGEKLGFRQPADWWRLTCDDLWNNYGTTLFNIIPSLAEIRRECCPEEREYERRKEVTAEQVLRWADEHRRAAREVARCKIGRSARNRHDLGDRRLPTAARHAGRAGQNHARPLPAEAAGTHQPLGSAAIVPTLDSPLGRRLFQAARRMAEAGLGSGRRGGGNLAHR